MWTFDRAIFGRVQWEEPLLWYRSRRQYHEQDHLAIFVDLKWYEDHTYDENLSKQLQNDPVHRVQNRIGDEDDERQKVPATVRYPNEARCDLHE